MDMYEDSPSGSATMAEKEEVDSRSIYVGNVSYTFLSSSNLLLLNICIRNEFQTGMISWGNLEITRILL